VIQLQHERLHPLPLLPLLLPGMNFPGLAIEKEIRLKPSLGVLSFLACWLSRTLTILVKLSEA
jgi:hypothetical protein